jgi:uncharacterized BrkB/YihY/UPF0761 family membrane protein
MGKLVWIITSGSQYFTQHSNLIGQLGPLTEIADFACIFSIIVQLGAAIRAIYCGGVH